MSSIRNILIVEDDHDTRDLLSQMLEQAGFSTICVPDAADALRVLSRQVIDLGVFDIQLPEMSGYNLLKMIRVRHPDFPAIAVSAFFDSRSRSDSIKQHGFQAAVPKQENLARRLVDAIEKC